jgi:hypothetical protein
MNWCNFYVTERSLLQESLNVIWGNRIRSLCHWILSHLQNCLFPNISKSTNRVDTQTPIFGCRADSILYTERSELVWLRRGKNLIKMDASQWMRTLLRTSSGTENVRKQRAHVQTVWTPPVLYVVRLLSSTAPSPHTAHVLVWYYGEDGEITKQTPLFKRCKCKFT